MKKAMSLLLSIVFVLGVFTYIPTYCNAVNYDDQVAPRWAYTASVTSTISDYRDNRVLATSSVICIDDVTKITIKQVVQRYSNGQWVDGPSWTQSKSDSVYHLSKFYSITESTSYRVKTVATVYCGSSYETVYDYSNPTYATYTP